MEPQELAHQVANPLGATTWDEFARLALDQSEGTRGWTRDHGGPKQECVVWPIRAAGSDRDLIRTFSARSLDCRMLGRWFKSGARNHLPANRPLEFSFEVST
jgi:hypothetical protein